jgi:hypothetical protein
MMCRENFIFHFSCSLGLKSLTVHSQGSTTTFEKLCVKFIYKDIKLINNIPYYNLQKFIPYIYDIEHYKHFFRNHNNLVIPKKRKKIYIF